MGESTYNRRKFLQTAALTAGGWGALSLSGCGSLDRLFGPDPGIYDDEVLIVGAGLAGLTAAYELKKRKIPFRVIEASARPGGRVQTMKFFNESGQHAELGGEFIDPRHISVADLCKELNLPLEEVPVNRGGEASAFWFRQQWFTPQTLAKDLHPLLNQMLKRRSEIENAAVAIDQMSWADWLKSQSAFSNERSLAYFSAAARVQFGVEPEQLSSLAMLSSLDPEARNSKWRRVEGGSENLTRALYERIRGVLPEFLVRFQTSLLSIREYGDRFECRVQTPRGSQTIWARCLIFALPPTALRKIGGLKELSISKKRQEAIEGLKMGSHSRLILGFEDRFWTESAAGAPVLGANLLGLPNLQSVSDASRGQKGANGILSFTWGGEAAKNASLLSKDEAVKDLRAVWKRAASEKADKTAFRNWAQYPHTQGSWVTFGPGEMSRWNGVFQDGDYKDRIFFAGEHTSTNFPGTMQGAVESGRRAAARVGTALEKLLLKAKTKV